LTRFQNYDNLSTLKMATNKDRPIGSKATRNGKPVVWAGEDYGFQSPESFRKLQRDGELALGAGLVRRVRQVGDQWEQFRHNTFGTVPDSNPVIRALKGAEDLMGKTPAGQAAQGADRLGREGARKLGISPAIGAMLLGSVVPGGGGSGPRWGTNRQLSRATRARQRQMIDGNPRPRLQQLAQQQDAETPRTRRHGTRQGDSQPVSDSNRQPPPSGDTQRRLNQQGVEVTSRAINDRPTQTQQQATERFFSGEGTAKTFASKKGKDIVPIDRIDDIVDSVFENNGKTYDEQGFYFGTGDKNPGRRGRSGQVQVLANSIQRQRIESGKAPYSKAQLARAVKSKLETYRNTELKGGGGPSPAEIERRNQRTERAGRELREQNRQMREGRSDGNKPPKPDARRQRSNLRQRPVVNEVPPTQGDDIRKSQFRPAQESEASTLTRRRRVRGEDGRPVRGPVISREELGRQRGETDPMVVRGDRARGERRVGQRPLGQNPSQPGDGGTRPANLQNPPRNRRGPRPELPTAEGFKPGGELRGLSTKGPGVGRPRKSQQSGGVYLTDEQFRALRESRRRRRNR
jgi:hypothetical protein